MYGTPTGMSPRRYPPPPPARDTAGATFGGRSNLGSGSCGEVVGLRTLILGNCEKISAIAFEAFLSIAAGSGGGHDGDAGRADAGTLGQGRGNAAAVGAGGGGRGGGTMGGSAADGRRGGVDGAGGERGDGVLSTVRLMGCRNLDDRGLKLLAVGMRDRLKDLQVCFVCRCFFLLVRMMVMENRREESTKRGIRAHTYGVLSFVSCLCRCLSLHVSSLPAPSRSCRAFEHTSFSVYAVCALCCFCCGVTCARDVYCSSCTADRRLASDENITVPPRSMREFCSRLMMTALSCVDVCCACGVFLIPVGCITHITLS